VRASLETGLVDPLREQQRTLSELRELTNIDDARLGLLLDALVAIGVVEQYDEHFALAQVGHLVPLELADLGDRYWRHLNDWVTHGTTIPTNDESDLDETDFLRERHASEWLQTPAAMILADQLGIGNQRTGVNILDIGCGSGVMSLSSAFRDPTSKVVAFDTATGLDRVRETITGIDMGDRVQLEESHEGLQDIPEGKFDIVMLANVAHYHREEVVEKIIERAAKRVKEGGEFVLVDIFPGQTKGNLNRTLFELQLALRYPQGQLHTRATLESFLKQAGLPALTFAPLEAPPWTFSVLRATRS
jgi:2-polyprenyl-3-methyl-5-hydroxy-6-metoxy-1,4-benzoquinol methylase